MSLYAKVSFEVVRASSLLGMNIGGTSNPFVKVEIGKTNFTTPTIDNTNEPNWREAGHQAQSTFSFPAIHVPTVVTISVYNKLPYGDQLSDFIGQASVTIMKPGQNQQTIPLTHGGNMQLANKAPTGCGMIEVSYNAEEVSETEYFDALLGKNTTTANVVPPAPIPDLPSTNAAPAAVESTTASTPAAVEQQQQQQQQQPMAESTNNLPTAASSMSDATSTLNNNGNNMMNSTLPPAQQQNQNQPQPEQTPDVSFVGDQQQHQQQPNDATTVSSLPQQHQIPALGAAIPNNNNNQENDQQQQQQNQQQQLPPGGFVPMNLPPRAPAQSGAMPSLDNNSNNNSNQQQATLTVQAPASTNVQPVPEPQAQVGYVPQVQNLMTTGPAPSSSRATMFNNTNNTSSSGRAPSSGRGRSNSLGRPPTPSHQNNHHNSVLMNKSSGNANSSMMMNHSTANNNNNKSFSMMSAAAHHGSGTTKAERFAAITARWFEMIRSGGNSVFVALREIRSACEKDPSLVLEACDASGRTLIHEAAWSGTVELFQELLSLAIRAGNTRGTAMSMQLWASEQHNVAAWSTVPPDGYQGPRYVTQNGGNTVLHTAATAGRSDLVDWMLRQGAVFVAMAQTRNKRGLRPLESAAERGHIETAQILARSTTA